MEFRQFQVFRFGLRTRSTSSFGRASLLAESGEDEELAIVEIEVGAIRDFRREESWRMEYRIKSGNCSSPGE